jgi:hypothetical protein
MLENEAAVPSRSCASVTGRVLLSNQEQQAEGVCKAERLGEMSRCRLAGKEVSALDRALEVRMCRSFRSHELMFA